MTSLLFDLIIDFTAFHKAQNLIDGEMPALVLVKFVEDIASVGLSFIMIFGIAENLLDEIVSIILFIGALFFLSILRFFWLIGLF